jgi:hypothetical protein
MDEIVYIFIGILIGAVLVQQVQINKINKKLAVETLQESSFHLVDSDPTSNV